MAQFTVYKSTDASAPTLTGEVDSLCLLLKACLVDGYGAKAAAGWTEAYDGANKKAFRQGAASDGAIQAYLRVLDDASSTGGAKEATCIGYESMSNIDTGTNAIGTFYWRKSATATNLVRDWILFADSRTFYLFILTGDYAGVHLAHGFGDFYSYVTADAYRICHFGGSQANVSGNHMGFPLTSAITISGGGSVARNYVGTVGAYVCALTTAYHQLPLSMSFPNSSNGAVFTLPLLIGDNTTHGGSYNQCVLHGHRRGALGLLAAPNRYANGDTFSGTGASAGKTFYVLLVKYSSTTYPIAIETSDTVDTN